MPTVFVDEYWAPLCRAAAATWPDANWPHWYLYDDNRAFKYVSHDASRLSESCKALMRQMSTVQCPRNSFPDLDLYAAGMNWLPLGGFLSRHSDSERHARTGWYRQWNAILFLSECEGGELVLEDKEFISPKCGRLVMFDPRLDHEVLPVRSGQRLSLSMFWWSLEGDGTTTKATFHE